MYEWASCKVQYRYSSQILTAQIFRTNFRKILKYRISRKSIEWKPSCSMRTDGRRKRSFSQFCSIV